MSGYGLLVEDLTMSSFCVGFCPGSDRQSLPTAPGQIFTDDILINIIFLFLLSTFFKLTPQSNTNYRLNRLSKSYRKIIYPNNSNNLLDSLLIKTLIKV